MLDNSAAEFALCFEAFTSVALAHEHSHRRSLLLTAATITTPGGNTQLVALRKRLTELLPPKLRSGMPASTAAAVVLELCAVESRSAVDNQARQTVPPRDLHKALDTALADLQWSGVGVLDGLASEATALRAMTHFLEWCEALLNVCFPGNQTCGLTAVRMSSKLLATVCQHRQASQVQRLASKMQARF